MNKINDNLINKRLIFRSDKMYEAKIKIGLKKGVSDPEGANTLKALKLLGFDNVKEAKTIRTVDLLIDGKSESEVRKSAEQMCQRLLTNPVIHTYEIEIIKK
jgi:phosphoribosylformylglycinamidine synthase